MGDMNAADKCKGSDGADLSGSNLSISIAIGSNMLINLQEEVFLPRCSALRFTTG